MAALFDNLDDVNSKFSGTICYYDKKPIYVKQAIPDPVNNGEFILYVQTSAGRNKQIKLTDPLFNYKHFNIGYANTGSYAAWFYRRPTKQYRQGLKKDQLYYKMSIAHGMPEESFNLSKSFIAMLENVYPKLEDCRELLMNHTKVVVAFHKDFALSWDHIHDDFFIEYRGKKIGTSVGHNLMKYNLLAEAKHLEEALQEALPRHVHG
jgi:hypothetical protein